MKNLKRICALCLAVAFCFTLTACRKNPSGDGSSGYFSSFSSEDIVVSDVESDVSSEDIASEDTGVLKNPTQNSQQAPTTSTGSQDSILGYDPNANSSFDPYKGVENYNGKTVKMLTWWSFSDDEQKRIDNFTSKYGIKVKPIKTDLANYQTKLAGLITSGSSPDLCGLQAEYFPMVVIKNRVQPIDTSYWNIEEDVALDKTLMDQFSWGGKYYGVNVKGSMFSERAVIFYNKSMFQNKGVKTPYEEYIAGNWNWDTMRDAATKLTNTAQGVYGFADRSYNAINWLLTNDTDLVLLNNDKITNNLTAEKVKTSMGYISDMIASGSVKTEASIADFLSGNVAMFAAGSSYMWGTNTIATSMKSAWGVAPFPSPKGQKAIVANEGTMWAFPANAKNVGAANYFIRYFLDPSNLTKDPCANEECTKVFSDISHTSDIRTCFSKGLISFNNADDFYAVVRCRLKSKNDIPVALQSYVKTVDEAINSAMNELSGG